MKYILFFLLTACTVNLKHPINVSFESTDPILSFKKDIRPIIVNRCSVCHNANWPEKNWLDYKTICNNRVAIYLRLVQKTMPPPGFNLPDDERFKIIHWLGQGEKP